MSASDEANLFSEEEFEKAFNRIVEPAEAKRLAREIWHHGKQTMPAAPGSCRPTSSTYCRWFRIAVPSVSASFWESLRATRPIGEPGSRSASTSSRPQVQPSARNASVG
jgi:hypothetical protein